MVLGGYLVPAGTVLVTPALGCEGTTVLELCMIFWERDRSHAQLDEGIEDRDILTPAKARFTTIIFPTSTASCSDKEKEP